MGKRKKSSRKPAPTRRKDPLVKVDRKEGLAQLVCRVCDQRYQSKVNHLTEPIDIYSEWIDAADAAEKGDRVQRRPAASSSRPRPAAPSVPSDDEDDEE
ncbi:hypothetical protein EWM64_g1391 [Hericium alpestre]|uniref:Transcription elongation factor 1 homolog n=1 Tax=Hericium alpestre TaxID=135208 RepID=A0A4Z0A8M7_9AGAM|nr:hypothetical protein EWM64_g1391 [Hericium alpestre]